MKLKHMLLALIPLCMASCSEEETIVSGESQLEVRVTAGASTQSRVVLNDEGDRISSLWEAGDKISLFTATQSNLVYSTDTHAATATFTPVDEALECREGNTVYACYPEVSQSRSAEEGMVVGLPSTTTMDYNNGSIRSFGYATSTISDGSVNFQFKHISAFIALNVTPGMLSDATKGISRITVSTSSTEPLSVGEGDTFDFSSLTASTGNGTNTVQINVDNYVVDSLWTVYIPVLPQPAGADITITLTDSEDQTLYTQTKQTPASGFLAGHTYHQKAVEVADVAYLVDGNTFNQSIKGLVSGSNIKKVQFVTESYNVPENHIIVSGEKSQVPIYASFSQADSLLSISTAAKRMEIENASNMFYNLQSLCSVDFGNFKINETTKNMSRMFYICFALTSLDVSNWNTSNVTDMNNMFSSCHALASLNLSNWNTEKVTNMNSMFYNCDALTSLDISNWDTTNVTVMNDMFGECAALTSLDISNWNTTNVTDMSNMFRGCNSLTSLNLSNWNTEKVTDMFQMFYDCAALTSLDVSNWNTANVTSMSHMFSSCDSLTSLNLSNWNTEKVTNMKNMFSSCHALASLNLSNWNTANVTVMNDMFYNCYALASLNLSNWNFNNNVTTGSMFFYCASTSKACRITSTQEAKDFLLARTSDTYMNPDYFIWGDVANGGSSLDEIPKEEW